MIVLYIVIPSRTSKPDSRKVDVQSNKYIVLLTKSSSELLSKISTAINTTKSSSKPSLNPKSESKSKNSKVVPMNGGRKRTKTKKEEQQKKRNNFNTQQ